MGASFGKLFARLFGKKDMRILMVGLDAAGMFPVGSLLLFAVVALYGLDLVGSCTSLSYLRNAYTCAYV